MRLLVLAILATLPALASGASSHLAAQVPPDAEWVTRTTAHFRITYPADLEDVGRRAAVRSEAAYALLSANLAEPPEEPIDVLVTDHTDDSNGFARVFPSNQVVVVAAPPTDGLSLSYFDDWLDLVLVHEIAHVLHLDTVGTPGAVVRAIFGRVPLAWPTFPGLATPGWTREGLATWYETSLTSAGRIDSAYFDMVLRTAALEGAFEELDQVSGRSPVWPDGERPYIYGSMFFEHLLERYGEERMTAFVHSVAGQWVPYRLDSAAEDAFGVSFGDAWQAWSREVETNAQLVRDSLEMQAPLTRPRPLTDHGRRAMRPAPSPSGDTLAYLRSDGRSDPQIHLLSPADGVSESGRKLTRTNGLSDFSWTPEGEIVFSQFENVDRYRLRSDLYRVDREGDVRRLTRNARLDQPSVAPGGGVAVAVEEGEGTSRLVEVDLADGAVSPLTDFDPEVHWAYPAVSPDGRWIAASRWQSGGYFDLVLLDRSGVVIREITRDRNVDLAPSWSPDGRWLVWSSDRSGIWNVFAVSITSPEGLPGDPVQLTNLVTGATYPSVGAASDDREQRLYFSGYHADGWHVEAVPFRPEAGFEPLGPGAASAGAEREPTPSASPMAGARDGEGPEDVGPYSPLPTLLPKYWIPMFLPGERAVVPGPSGDPVMQDILPYAVGITTSGRDLVGRHSFGAQAVYSPEDERVEGGVGYIYAGFGNPVLALAVGQSYDAAVGAVILSDEAGEEAVVPVERERGVLLSASFVRNRYRDVLSLTLNGGYVRERLMYRGLDLEGSGRFRPSRPDRNLIEGGITLAGDRTQRHAFSISSEDGVRGFIRGRARVDLGLPGGFVDVAGRDRSFQEAVGGVRLYRSIPGPGFARHVLAVRMTGAAARGPGADAFHYEVGGASGVPEPVTGFGLFGGTSLLLPVRGFEEGDRFGRFAWSGSAEYRFPVLLVHQGLGLFPLHLDRISGSLFFDAGNAWGPELGSESIRFQNPRRGVLSSAGAELAVDVLPLWAGSLTLRVGVAERLRGGEGTTFHVRLGGSF